MIAPRRPALPPSERTYLEQSKRAKRDGWFTATLFTALALSIAACVYFFQHHQLLLFPAAIAQLSSARHFVSGPPALNFAQLGGTNLPLPTLLMAPFAWNDSLWRTGLAGSIPSMICYIITGLYIFLSVRMLTGRSIAAYLGALIFLLNPTMLYLQSIPVGELASIATLTMTCYYTLAWIRSGKLAHLLEAAGSLCLATLCRYDAWLLFVIIFALVLVVGLVKGYKRAQINSNLLMFSLPGGLGIGVWVAWCWTMYGDPLYFLHTRFLSQAALQNLASSGALSTAQGTWQPLHFYATAALGTLGPALAALALLATAVFLLRHSFKLEGFAALALLAPPALSVAAMYNGLLLLALPFAFPVNIQDQLFQVCLGAGTVVPSAIFIATLIGGWSWKPKA